MDRKGEITSQTLVWTIVIVLGFGLILLVYFQINWTGNIDSEACHQSVIFRATLPSTLGINSYVPLKCKTNKICVTSGWFGGCGKDYGNSKGITNARVSDVQQIEKLMTDNLFDCWKMMGEGKVSVFSNWLAESYGLKTIYPSCVVCNRIAFDYDSLAKEKVQLKDMDVDRYMKTHLIPNGNITYYQYFISEGGKFSLSNAVNSRTMSTEEAAKILKDQKFTDSEITDLKNVKFEQTPVVNGFDYSKDNLAIIFSQISAPKRSSVFENTLVAATVLTGGALSAGAGKVLFTKGGALSTIALYIFLNIGQQMVVTHQQATAATYCGDISTGDDARYGCSVTRIVTYNISDINSYCSVIESIP